MFRINPKRGGVTALKILPVATALTVVRRIGTRIMVCFIYGIKNDKCFSLLTVTGDMEINISLPDAVRRSLSTDVISFNRYIYHDIFFI